MHWKVAATAFVVGVASLMYELTQVRMLAFLVGGSMDFLAIPLALLGLAMGSMFCHLVWRGSLQDLVSWAAQALFPVLTVCLVGVFVVMDTWFPQVQAHAGYAHPWAEASRVLVYAAVFLPPYLLFGAMLAALFTLHADRVGRLYFFDLAGAALGCVLAPTLLTLFDLPETLIMLMGLSLGLLLLYPPKRQWLVAPAVALFVLVAGLGQRRVLLREHPDATFLSSAALKFWIDLGRDIEEVDVRWNEVARTALVRVVPDGPYAIVQDNGLSNVTLLPWDPAERGRPVHGHRSLAWQLGMEPRSILVVFAGTARDMVTFDQLADGKANIVGVELNPDVVRMADHPAVSHLRLNEFLAEPNIELVHAEGREFLNRDTRIYDLIQVANNGAVFALRTGHTRKFLDTEEAMAAYLARLSPDGLMVFSNQPVAEKIVAFRRLLPDADQALVLWGRKGDPTLDTLVVKPSGFSDDDVAVIERNVGELDLQILQAPGRERQGWRSSVRVTDDRPFTRGLGLRRLDVFPRSVPEPWLLSSWIKVFTIVVFTGVSGLVGLAAVALGGQRARVPAGWVGFLLLSGIGYMCVEIGLIAKTELFLGNPLYSVAINLALFLVSNAVGSAIQDRYAPLDGPAKLVAAVLATVAWSLVAIALLTPVLLSAVLAVKVAGIAVITTPVGIVLGMFYPFCVTRLLAAGRGASVPITYGLTTLASVLGSSFAMTAIIELGFTRVIGIGALAYALAGLAAFFATKAAARG